MEYTHGKYFEEKHYIKSGGIGIIVYLLVLVLTRCTVYLTNR